MVAPLAEAGSETAPGLPTQLPGADMPEFIGATLGAAIALAVLAVAYQRWGYSR